MTKIESKSLYERDNISPSFSEKKTLNYFDERFVSSSGNFVMFSYNMILISNIVR